MKQTAVEFISKGLFDILQEAEDNNVFEIGTQNFKRYIEIFSKQANKMFEEQIIEAYKRERAYMKYAGCTDEQINKSAQQHYNETFKSE